MAGLINSHSISIPDWRKRYVDMVETARDQGAACQIFSSQHVSGEQLQDVGFTGSGETGMTGIRCSRALLPAS